MMNRRWKTEQISVMLSRCKTSSASINNPEVQRSVSSIKNATEDTNGTLSKFNLIAWRKSRYQPSQNQRRLKIQNDISLHVIANEKMRPKVKPIINPQSALKELSSTIKFNYRKHYDHIKAGLTSSKFEMTHLQEIEHHEESSISAFKQRHQRLCSYMLGNLNQNKQDSEEKEMDDVVEGTVVARSVKQKQQVNKLIYVKTENVIKTNNVKINGRIEQILKKFKGSKKSINQRYLELWGPSAQKKKGFMIHHRNRTGLTQFQATTTTVLPNLSAQQSVIQEQC